MSLVMDQGSLQPSRSVETPSQSAVDPSRTASAEWSQPSSREAAEFAARAASVANGGNQRTETSSSHFWIPGEVEGHSRRESTVGAAGRMSAGDEVQEQVNGNGAVTGVGGRSPQRLGRQQETDCGTDALVWDVISGARVNYEHLGRRLAAYPDLFRNGEDGYGLIRVLPSGQSRLLTKAADLIPVLADRLRIVVTKDGKSISDLPGSQHLNSLLRSETFLSCFRSVDAVVCSPYYLPDFALAQPGYHDGGVRKRILYIGPVAEIADTTETIGRFLDAMDFASMADRTNTVAAALTARLRHRWPGAKPIIPITATKSFAGKTTVKDFICGPIPSASLLYQDRDWPMRSEFQRQVQLDPEIGILVIDNARTDSSGGRGGVIRSAFLEGLATSAEILQASPGGGEPLRVANQYVVVFTTNDGALSADLLNRAMSIHLTPKGDVQDRRSPIGNPRLEFLPNNRERIEAELRGMIERWRIAGCPLEEGVEHPMTPWARTVGGILRVSGFAGFLGSQRAHRTVDDPIRKAIGILGAENPGNARRPSDWAELAVELGLAKTLFSSAERDTPAGRERAIGVVLSRHRDETFVVETEEAGRPIRLRLQLKGGFRRWERGTSPSKRYSFDVLGREVLPLDEVEMTTDGTATVDVAAE
jgi:hypothetical protein